MVIVLLPVVEADKCNAQNDSPIVPAPINVIASIEAVVDGIACGARVVEGLGDDTMFITAMTMIEYRRG